MKGFFETNSSDDQDNDAMLEVLDEVNKIFARQTYSHLEISSDGMQPVAQSLVSSSSPTSSAFISTISIGISIGYLIRAILS